MFLNGTSMVLITQICDFVGIISDLNMKYFISKVHIQRKKIYSYHNDIENG